MCSSSLATQMVKNLPANAGDIGSIHGLGRKFPWRRDRLPIPVFLGFPGSSIGKESACNAGDLGLIPRLGRSPGGEHGNPFKYSCLENPHGPRSLVGYSPWSIKESDMTEGLSTSPCLFQTEFLRSTRSITLSASHRRLFSE